MPVVRISRGSFPPEKYEKVKSRLDTSQESLIQAIRKLNGLLHYYVGIDHVSNTMVNVSVWKSLADAKQMDTLTPMLTLASEFTQLGVSFERPIINYDAIRHRRRSLILTVWHNWEHFVVSWDVRPIKARYALSLPTSTLLLETLLRSRLWQRP
jgi:hypothetical protein